MHFLFVLADTGVPQLTTISQYFFTAGLFMLVMMAWAYLLYTVGSARLAKQLATEGSSQATTDQASKVAVAGGSVATLTRSDVVLHEQPDGEQPIALNKRLLMIGRTGSILGWLAFLMFVASQALRTVVTGHAPWSNLYEFSLSFTAALLFCYLLFEARFHERVRAWGLYVCLLSLATIGLAVYIGSSYGLIDGTNKLIPALQDMPILTVHVGMAIFAYAMFSVAFGAGLIILIQNGEGQRYAWLPSAEAADELAYKAVIIGFPLLALNLILGAYWANYAWGHYWSWDPKETSALVTWLIYAVYLHARGIRGWRGNRIGWVLTIGFIATLFTYYGVSFFVPSLHSYATPK